MIESKGWELEAHVRPIDDLVEHSFDADCVCGPRVDEDETGHIVVVHHSLDGREFYEDDYEDVECDS